QGIFVNNVAQLAGNPAQMDVALIDSRNRISNAVHVSVRPYKNLGATCDPTLDAPDECAAELVCQSSTCAATPAVSAACAAATALTLGAAPIMGMTSDTGPDLFSGTCLAQPGGNDGGV